MKRSEFLAPTQDRPRTPLLLSAYNLAGRLIRNFPGHGALLLECNNAQGFLCYWVGLDTEPLPQLPDARLLLHTWFAPTECWPALPDTMMQPSAAAAHWPEGGDR